MKTVQWIANKQAHLALAKRICTEAIAEGKDMQKELLQITAKIEILKEVTE